jgi:Ca2+-binding EF-hand superfamily protein
MDGDKPIVSKHDAKKLFKKYDLDHDGQLSEEELVKALSPPFTRDEIKALIVRLDRNNDGKINGKGIKFKKII